MQNSPNEKIIVLDVFTGAAAKRKTQDAVAALRRLETAFLEGPK